MLRQLVSNLFGTLVVSNLLQWHPAIVSCWNTVAPGLSRCDTCCPNLCCDGVQPSTLLCGSCPPCPHAILDMHGYAHILFFPYLEKHVLDRLGCCFTLIVLLPFLFVFDQVVLTTNCLHQAVDSIVATVSNCSCCRSSLFAVCSPLL